jgi:hypothetical protein
VKNQESGKKARSRRDDDRAPPLINRGTVRLCLFLLKSGQYHQGRRLNNNLPTGEKATKEKATKDCASSPTVHILFGHGGLNFPLGDGGLIVQLKSNVYIVGTLLDRFAQEYSTGVKTVLERSHSPLDSWSLQTDGERGRGQLESGRHGKTRATPILVGRAAKGSIGWLLTARTFPPFYVLSASIFLLLDSSCRRHVSLLLCDSCIVVHGIEARFDFRHERIFDRFPLRNAHLSLLVVIDVNTNVPEQDAPVSGSALKDPS